MTFDANVKMAIAKELIAIANKKNNIAELTEYEQELIERVFARELVSTIAAAICIFVKEVLTVILFAWPYYLILRPLYWLVWEKLKYKLGGEVSGEDLQIIADVKNNTLSMYWTYGLMMPIYRFFHKLILGIPELFYGLGCAWSETGIAKKLPEAFNSQVKVLDTGLSASSQSSDANENTITTKKLWLKSLSSFNSSASMFSSRSMFFSRQGSSSSTDTSPIATERKSPFVDMSETSAQRITLT